MTRWPRGGVAAQLIERGPDDRARWLLRTEPAESLARFRTEHRDWTIATSTTTLCGQRVDQLIASHDEEHITCVMTATGNHPAWIPPRRIVAVELTHRGLPVVLTFETESEHLEAWRDVETQFFAAIRCER